MISLTPTGSPAETAAAYTLLAIIADPVMAKKHLDSLVAEKQTTLEAAAAARKDLEEIKSQRSEADKVAQATASSEDRTKRIADQIGERESAVARRDKEITDREAAHSKLAAAFSAASSAKEASLTERERAVAAEEKRLAALTKAAEDLKSDLESRKATIQTLMQKVGS